MVALTFNLNDDCLVLEVSVDEKMVATDNQLLTIHKLH
jgi:hypothetical protein